MNELGGIVSSNTLQYLQTFENGTETREQLVALGSFRSVWARAAER